ncbi:hypothetical protein TWF132_003381 [Orbilia oligospora]|nr:hypothetical protein TWF751_005965 [Orbilia oligospora]KAF3294392.1 hypothetical protein TWF132_003381 [Orbilia oligospora]
MESHPMIIDSHIHLWRTKDIPTLAWETPENPLFGTYDLDRYLKSILSAPSSYSGFVFVETDRKYTDPKDPSEDLQCWEHVLEEYRFVLSLSKEEEWNDLVRGIVPWAPVHLGREAMERYQKLLDAVDEEIYGEEKHGLLVGFRYLIQDKPQGTASLPRFLEGLEYIRDTGRTFDVGVDCNRHTLWQLEEVVPVLKRVKGLKIVLNHLSKPPLGREPEGGMARWRELMTELAETQAVVKLSGGFSEIPPTLSKEGDAFPEQKMINMVLDYARPLFQIFGASRVIFGSDWPVCGVGYEKVIGEQAGAWPEWFKISTAVIKQLKEEGGVTGEPEDWNGIWGENALGVYNLKPQ